MNPSLKSRIMRRVYYSYLLSIGSTGIFWQGIFLGAAVLLLGRRLHVSSIIDNLLTVPVREAPSFVASSFMGAFYHGEAMTALIMLYAITVTVLVSHRLGRLLANRVMTAHS